MKVLLVSPGATWSTADVHSGLRYGLVKHGVEVIDYSLDQRIGLAQRVMYGQWRQTKKVNPAAPKPSIADVFYQAGIGALEKALRHRVDVVLVVSAMYFHPDVFVMMKRAGLTVTVLLTESPYDFEKEAKVAALVSGVWTNERSSVPALLAVNPNTGYIPHGWHPEKHLTGAQPGDEDVPAHDVVFVGSAFRERVQWLSAIDWSGIDLGLYGNWTQLGSRHKLRQFIKGAQVDNRVAAALYRRAKVGLNLYRTSVGWGKNAPAIAHAESMNPRAYELARCGAFHVSDYRAEVREVFGDLVPTFSTPTEAAALIRSWLADDAGRRAVAAQLPACVAETSWAERATRIIGDLQTLLAKQAA
jgi:hypothetical protein